MERLESIELENARGDSVNTFMFVAPKVKLFESVYANLAAELAATITCYPFFLGLAGSFYGLGIAG